MKDRVFLDWMGGGEWAVTVTSELPDQNTHNQSEADFVIVAKSRERAEAILRDLGRVLAKGKIMRSQPPPKFIRAPAETGFLDDERPF